MRIYVNQFGYWWSFTPDNWEKMLTDMLNKVVNFDDYGKELKSVPYYNLIVYRAENTEGYVKSAYYSSDENKVKVYSMVCDWDHETIKYTLQELKEWNL